MDVIAVLKEDHKKVEALFKQIEEASERAKKTKRRLFQQISTELTLHAAAEENILYPRLKELPELKSSAFEALEEHRLVKQLLAEIAALLDQAESGPGDGQGGKSGVEVGDGMGPEWDAKVKVLIDMVRHHVREEEGEIFRDMRAQLKRPQLVELGEAILAFKKDPRAAMPRAGGAEARGEKSQKAQKVMNGHSGRSAEQQLSA
jgi:hypothetical protein